MTVLTGRSITGEGIRIRLEGDRIAETESRPVAREETYLVPGLVDLQVNGYGGHDINDAAATAETVIAMVEALARVGTTTVVPTIITGSPEHILERLATIRQARAADLATAAAIPYIHLEGPSLSPVEGPRGAHDPSLMRPPDLDELSAWQEASGDMVGMVTLSPHYDKTVEFIAEAVTRGVRISLGHTHADPAQLRAAVDAGARFATHLGNGLQATLPRHPNAIWTQLADDRLTAGLIADGHHLPDDTLKVMLRAKGRGRCFVTSDSVALAGAEPGRYRAPVGGEVELFPDGRLCVADTPYLAGAAVPLLDNLRALHRIGLPLSEAVELTSGTPGRIADRGGALVEGMRADILELGWDDNGPVLHRIWWGGRELPGPSSIPVANA